MIHLPPVRRLARAAPMLAALLLAACVGLENSTADMFSVVEGKPAQAKALETMPLTELSWRAPSGFQEYELARRFETGVGGVSPDMECALFFYTEAATQTVVVRETNVQMGGMVDTNYLGLPIARRALKRLAADGHVLPRTDYAKASMRCWDLKASFWPKDQRPKPSADTPS
ncbi:hypothetical protein SAMN02799626_00344 [Caulobacter sp. UNC279MFTsu5.1]|nr:hypothetical protein SAMN02799626_00344 [Caulobacter sp. UNC279MFTsu5.1]